MRPTGDMTNTTDAPAEHPAKRAWFERKVADLAEAIEDLPEDRATLVGELLAEEVPLFTEDDIEDRQ